MTMKGLEDLKMVALTTVIPVYNAEKTVSDTLNSVLASVNVNPQIICVDDGSKDGSAEVLDLYANEHENILVIHSINGGVSRARNIGIDTSQTDYITFVDSDDTISNDMYSDIMSYIIDNDLDCVECGFNQVTLNHSQSHIVTEKDCILTSETGILDEVIKPLLGHSKSTNIFSQGCVWNKVFKRHIISENNIRFNENRTSAEDWQFVIEYFAKCARIGFLSKSYYNYLRTGVISLSCAYSEWYQVALENRKLFSQLFPSLEWKGKREVNLMLLVISAVENVRVHFNGSIADQKIKNLFTVAQQSGIYKKSIPTECDKKQRRIITALQNAINNDDFDAFKHITFIETNRKVLINKTKRNIKTIIKKTIAG